jgi:DNA-binding LacI/PurR family transcriptional regulator
MTRLLLQKIAEKAEGERTAEGEPRRVLPTELIVRDSS